jgi:hypothetical protein
MYYLTSKALRDETATNAQPLIVRPEWAETHLEWRTAPLILLVFRIPPIPGLAAGDLMIPAIDAASCSLQRAEERNIAI